MSQKIIRAFIFISMLCIGKNSFAQAFLNGDFEINTAAACDYNMINASFTAKMSNAVAYGVGNELDIMQTSCPYGPSQNGTWFAALAFPSGSDAFTMKLSAPLAMGSTYLMRFYDKGDVVCCAPGMPVVIGISTVAGAGGTVVYTGPTPTGGVWNLRCFSFVAPNAGQYVSVSTAGPTRWSHVDNFAIVATCAVLPIELKEFTAACLNNTTVLNWTTASEKNNNYFSVERTVNGNDFIEIGIVKSSGNSNTNSRYTFTDNSPIKGLAYYRLKQVDKNNETNYSPLASPEPCDAKQELEYEIFPNPATTELNINLKNCSGNCRLLITTPMGKTIYNCSIENSRNTINVSDFIPGFYMIQIITDEKTISRKFIKN